MRKWNTFREITFVIMIHLDLMKICLDDSIKKKNLFINKIGNTVSTYT